MPRAVGRLGAAGPVVIAIASATMLAWTWGTWADAIVDYGREVYLPWQVAAGRLLYLDLAHFSGPLSVELNALVFRLFGPAIRTLVVLNILLGAAFVALLYDQLVRLAGRLAATVGCLVFVLVFACGQYTGIGNYNWICPYSHELVHGAMLSVAALWALDRRARTARETWLVAVGLALGLLVLTKAETLLAGGVAVAVGLALVLIGERASPARCARAVAVVAAAAVVPLALTLLRYAWSMPLATILKWPLGHWLAAARPELRATDFYQSTMGFDEGTQNLGTMATALACEALGVAAAVATALWLRPAAGRAVVAVGLGVATAGALWRWVPMDVWFEAPRALPVWTAFLAGAAFADLARHRDDATGRARAALRTAFAVFATALLAKMLLNVRISHYGFVLAMPATVLVVVAMVEWLPAFVARRGGYGDVVRAIGLGVIAAAVAAHLAFMRPLLASKTQTIGRDGDAFRVDARGAMASLLLHEIETRVGADETLLVLPQGVMLNYLARRTNPTPYYIFDRTFRTLWGEDAITDRVRAQAPDWIAFIERGPGLDAFGRQRFVALEQWIEAHYEPVWRVGESYFSGTGPGGMLLRRVPGT